MHKPWVWLVLVLAALAIICAVHYFTVDKCLDGGGRWNAPAFTCEHEPAGAASR